jgi:hypothetical protein
LANERKAGPEMTPTPLFIPAPQPYRLDLSFEADFSLLDGVKPNIIIFKQQFVTAPLIILKLQPDGRLLPIVIQVRGPRYLSPRYLLPLGI